MKSSVVFFLAAVCLAVSTPTGLAESPDTLSETRFVAPQTKAMVVFVRSRGFEGKGSFSFVLDENERLATGLKGNRYATLVLEPGQYSFFVFAARSGRWVELDVLPGRTYLIGLRYWNEVRARLEIKPARRDETTVDDAREWLADAKLSTADHAKLNHKLALLRRAMKFALEQGNQERARGLAGYADLLALRPEDGFTRKEAIALGAPK